MCFLSFDDEVGQYTLKQLDHRRPVAVPLEVASPLAHRYVRMNLAAKLSPDSDEQGQMTIRDRQSPCELSILSLHHADVAFTVNDAGEPPPVRCGWGVLL